MQAGKLRHRITIQQPTVTRGATYKEPQEAWADLVTVWANVTPLTGREFFQNREVHGQVDHRISMRYQPGITSKMRIIFGARIFEIEAVMDIDERHRELQLMCREMLSG